MKHWHTRIPTGLIQTALMLLCLYGLTTQADEFSVAWLIVSVLSLASTLHLALTSRMIQTILRLRTCMRDATHKLQAYNLIAQRIPSNEFACRVIPMRNCPAALGSCGDRPCVRFVHHVGRED